MIGAGCAVQAVAILVALGSFILGPVVGLAGLVAGLAIFMVGSRMAIKFVCSECGNKLEDKRVRMCPTCRAEF